MILVSAKNQGFEYIHLLFNDFLMDKNVLKINKFMLYNKSR